jgi:4a-hydroxytetrahydrobiopterin dehydratase
MATLMNKKFTSVNENTEPLTDKQIEDFKMHIFGWDIAEDNGVKHLKRAFKFSSFEEVLLFADKVREKADTNNHHPRITVAPDRATIEWWTEKLNGLHENDFIMAAKTGDIYDRWESVSGKKDKIDKAVELTFPASDPPPTSSRIE